MIAFFTTLLRLFLQAFRSKRNILTENALLKKENEILARKMGKKRVHFDFYDKLFLVVLIDFLAYNLVSIKTGVEAPNMNSIMERFFRTVRREALDNFLLIGRSQIERILEEYVTFYNSQRPHQGLQQQIPNPGEPEKIIGAVCRNVVLGGLHHHYYRQAA